MSRSALDQFDRRLLAAVQQDASLTGEALAERVGLSPAACRRRLQQLKSAGVIEREVAILSPEAVGQGVTLIVLVTLADDRLDVLDGFSRILLAEPEVIQGWYVTGEADFALTVSTTDMAAYEDFTRRVFFDNPHVKRFETMVAMKRVKYGLELPVRVDG